VEGVVQGVGFRPFVYALAMRLGLSGHVGNDADGVFIEVEGPPALVAEFLVMLESEPPPLARVERVRSAAMAVTGGAGFAIAPSPAGGSRNTLVPPDSATCADCLAEMRDPGDRRFRYPFINCTNCGPRFTIVRDVPYDRPMTTMAQFPMCDACAAEYADPADRRFHAQPVCCPACGPTLRLLGSGTPLAGDALTGDAPTGDALAQDAPTGADALAGAAALLRDGRVLAVKGLGGYHLAADAGSEAATGALRARKHREDKPFAIMVADVDAARQLCEVDAAAQALLVSGQRPIVLLPRRRSAPVADAVAPGSHELGIMLPYTPMHHLLLAETGRPVVLTSGNVSDEPIAYEDADAMARLAGIADDFLVHDRPIHMRTDDSLVRVFRGREMVLRRSRGYVPAPLPAGPFTRPVLGCGAELKNTFCLGKDSHAFVSHHIGDLENYETLKSFTSGIEHFQRLFDVRPAVVAHDLHPEYLSTKYALELPDVELVGVQHHHAHIASCLADNRYDGPVIGVAFDGTGYGLDGTLWGGEFLLADLASFTRAGYLEPVPLPGGAAAIRQPWRMAAAYLGDDAGFLGDDAGGLEVARRHASQWDAVVALGRSGLNSPLTSSAGRLFDAVAAVLGVRDEIRYEGQAAIELERLADPAVSDGYPCRVSEGAELLVLGRDLVLGAAQDIRSGISASVIAARFHNGVAEVIAATCGEVRARSGRDVVALSGGVFQNVLLLTRTVGLLEAAGFRVLTHSRVPPNDGGISLGQAVVAGCLHDRGY
jgi:hydrogenase maturation protein HypF